MSFTSLKHKFTHMFDSNEVFLGGFFCGYNSVLRHGFPIGLTLQGQSACVTCTTSAGFEYGCKQMLPTLPIAFRTDRDICHCSALVCDVGLKRPEVALDLNMDCCCVREVVQIPFGSHVSEPVCGFCFVKCLPAPVEVAKRPPFSAPSLLSMVGR